MLQDHWKGRALIEYIPFYVWDKGTNSDSSKVYYSQANRGRDISPHGTAVMIFPVRNDHFALRVEILDKCPALTNAAEWDRHTSCKSSIDFTLLLVYILGASLATAYLKENDRYLSSTSSKEVNDKTENPNVGLLRHAEKK